MSTLLRESGARDVRARDVGVFRIELEGDEAAVGRERAAQPDRAVAGQRADLEDARSRHGCAPAGAGTCPAPPTR
jgi:hypothetical protein